MPVKHQKTMKIEPQSAPGPVLESRKDPERPRVVPGRSQGRQKEPHKSLHEHAVRRPPSAAVRRPPSAAVRRRPPPAAAVRRPPPPPIIYHKLRYPPHVFQIHNDRSSAQAAVTGSSSSSSSSSSSLREFALCNSRYPPTRACGWVVGSRPDGDAITGTAVCLCKSLVLSCVCILKNHHF